MRLTEVLLLLIGGCFGICISEIMHFIKTQIELLKARLDTQELEIKVLREIQNKTNIDIK